MATPLLTIYHFKFQHVSVTPVRLRKMFVNQETVVVYADHLILEEVAKHVTEGIMGTQHAMVSQNIHISF